MKDVPKREMPPSEAQKYDEELINICGDLAATSVDRIFRHLRDAREAHRHADEPMFARIAVILAAASLESNLSHLTARALAIAAARPALYSREQLEYLRGIKTVITERGALKEVPLKQSLEERLQLVPDLLARAFGRRYVLPAQSAAIRKMRRTIELRDAIIHPRWDRYVPAVTEDEAAQAIDAIELYLESIQQQLHPYLVGYISALMTIRGWDKHDVAVGHRTAGKRVQKSAFKKMLDEGIATVIAKEWFGIVMICSFALESGTDRGEEGSLLTRAAIVLLFAGLDAQLSIVAQWHLHDPGTQFEPVERLFLEENIVQLGQDGEIEVIEDRQAFKQRIVAVPTILARRVEGKEIKLDIGTTWGEQLQKSYLLRNQVVHAPPDKPLARVSHDELYDACLAVQHYITALTEVAPITFEVQSLLVKKNPFVDPAKRPTVQVTPLPQGWDTPLSQ
jgi:hypothetical protein